MESSLSKLESAVARMEGIVTTEIKHLGHDVKNLSAKMDAQAELFVPRRELEANDKMVKDRLKAVEDRIGWADKRLWTAALAALGAFGTLLINWLGSHLGISH